MMPQETYAMATGGITQQVLAVGRIPQAKMDMTTTPSLIGERFGSEGGIDTMAGGHTPHGFPYHQLLISGTQGVGMLNRKFLLPWPEFRIVLLHGNILLLQGLDDIDNDGMSAIHADRTKAIAAIEGHESPFVIHPSQV